MPQRRIGFDHVPDYLVAYVKGDVLHLADLIYDDHFKAIEVLFTSRHVVSCSKLLLSCIDTLAFIEFDDIDGNFEKWINAYVDLTSHGITAKQLWEYRHSILHMTNLASRSVLRGQVSPIVPYFGAPPALPFTVPLPKHFNLLGLIQSTYDGIGRWGKTYNTDREKVAVFIKRYGSTISDNRVAWITPTNES